MTNEIYQGNPKLRNVRIEAGEDVQQFITGSQCVTMIPLKIRRRHNKKILMPTSGSATSMTSGGLDIPMVKTLGKAFYWQRLLDEGKYATTSDLARTLNLETGWVAEVLRMANLAPEIVEAILEGRQPRHLNLHTIRGRNTALPREWEEQKKSLNFTN